MQLFIFRHYIRTFCAIFENENVELRLSHFESMQKDTHLPSTHESKVVLPHPLGPSKAYTEPADTVNERPQRIWGSFILTKIVFLSVWKPFCRQSWKLPLPLALLPPRLKGKLLARFSGSGLFYRILNPTAKNKTYSIIAHKQFQCPYQVRISSMCKNISISEKNER